MPCDHEFMLRDTDAVTHQSGFPAALDESLVGTYSALAKAGGGYVWDAVLEYRVWCSPRSGAEDRAEGSDYCYSFPNYDEALEFAVSTRGASDPLALVLQEEFIDEPQPDHYVHVRERRITERPVDFLTRPRRDDRTIPDFLAHDAPPNRLAILRGEAPRECD
jgi:hypothetical protein